MKLSSTEYAKEIAGLLCRYEDVRSNWRQQDAVWKDIRKRLIQYRMAIKAENKQNRRTLWETERQRKKQEVQQRKNPTQT